MDFHVLLTKDCIACFYFVTAFDGNPGIVHKTSDYN